MIDDLSVIRNELFCIDWPQHKGYGAINIYTELRRCTKDVDTYSVLRRVLNIIHIIMLYFNIEAGAYIPCL